MSQAPWTWWRARALEYAAGNIIPAASSFLLFARTNNTKCSSARPNDRDHTTGQMSVRSRAWNMRMEHAHGTYDTPRSSSSSTRENAAHCTPPPLLQQTPTPQRYIFLSRRGAASASALSTGSCAFLVIIWTPWNCMAVLKICSEFRVHTIWRCVVRIAANDDAPFLQLTAERDLAS